MVVPFISVLPVEVLLKVFEFLIPNQVYEVREKKDLQNLRLTCRQFEPCAAELLFQHYDMVLRITENNEFYKSNGYNLLLNNPSLSQLVRSVRISVASYEYEDIIKPLRPGSRQNDELAVKYLRRCICVGLGMRPVKPSAYLSESEFDASLYSFPVPELEDLRSFYQRYVKEPEHANSYRCIDLAQLREEMSRRVLLLPNLHTVTLSLATIERLPLHADMVQFWDNRGFGAPYNIRFLEAIFGRNDPLPWSTHCIMTGLQVLPRQVQEVSVSIKPFWALPTLGDIVPNLDDVLQVPEHVYRQITELSLIIDPYFSYVAGMRTMPPVSQWITLITRFQSLTCLSLDCFHEKVPTWKKASHFPLFFFGKAAFPELRRLELSRWNLAVEWFLDLCPKFPKLQHLLMNTIALDSDASYENFHWYHMAEAIGISYMGRCVLEFGEGEFSEVEGNSSSRIPNLRRSISRRVLRLQDPPRMAITIRTRKLKPVTLDILSSVSQHATRNEELFQQYEGLVVHVPPILTSEIQVIDTAGMRHWYYPHA